MSTHISKQISRRWLLSAGLALCGSACSQLAFLAANVPASFSRYSRQRDQPYGELPRQTLDVYLPENLPGKAQGAATIIFFHGGGWSDGDKASYKFVGAALAAQGYIAVLPNYRLYPQVKFAGFMQDAALATAWVAAHLHELGGDPQRLFLMGHSAGAHIALMLTLNSAYLGAVNIDIKQLAGVMGLAGPYDFFPFREEYLFDLFGPAARYAESQPINYARADTPPLWLAHGSADKRVSPTNTQHLFKALQALGAPVQMREYADAGHGDLVAGFSIPARGRVPVLHDVVQFIDGKKSRA